MPTPIIQPPTIRYNLKDRGRQFRGQERNFNIKALCDSINGGATQERVRTRAMLGYFGHKPRILAGMEPSESMVVNGKYNEIEPAIVTVSLKCDMDGNIEHKTEFLDTPSGRKAARMFANRIGGFSSVIDQSKNEYYGQDYVLDPNFSGNRPYALDSVDDSGHPVTLTLDQVLDAVKTEEDDFWTALVGAKDAQIAQLTLALDSATTENEDLLSILASKNTAAVLDSAAIMPLSISLDSANRMARDAAFFKQTARLPGFIESIDSNQAQVTEKCAALVDRMRHA